MTKAEARKAAFARRRTADPGVAAAANRHLTEAVRAAPGTVVAGYWPIRTEIDPRQSMHDLAAIHTVCLPVVVGTGQPLAFRRWAPESAMEEGAYGAAIPADGEETKPEILIVPLAAFDENGYRLGYGGGFYDRTLERLRASGAVTAIGFAYDVQMTEDLQVEPTDQPLDAIVTETGIRRFG
ncbi:MAG: 5-formyltetrahydrofolate cyclo-ligase [Paracoccaceae bacterium]|nr:5-formyltetrahydrofolate cyclo-ligase [Paracoccaceae bacterium]